MGIQLFANNAASTLLSNITNVATSLTVASGEGAKFPSPIGGDYFKANLCQMYGLVEINHEIVKVTARSSDVFTIVRAQEGTTGLAYNSGDKFELRLTKETMEGLEAIVQKDATNGYAGLNLFKLNLKNAANTFTNFFTNTTTAARTWTLPDKDGTVAMTSDIGSAAWSIKTTTYTAVTGDYLMADTTSAAFTITLPATPSANHVVNIADYAGTYATNNLTIGRNSSKIMSLSEDMVISTNNISITLTYIDATRGWALT